MQIRCEATVLSLMILSFSSLTHGQSQDLQDIKIIHRLLGSRVNSQDPQIQTALSQMKNPATRLSALRTLTQQQDAFYKITVKNLASRMSVRTEEVSAPLNDFSATVIGVTRDNLDARELLTGNKIYMADQTRLPQGVTIQSDLYLHVIRSNTHYQDLENNLYRIRLADVLTPVDQQLQRADNDNTNANRVVDLVTNPDPAGLLTSNTWGREHLIMGTNRRAVEYALRSFLCTPMEEAADTQASDARIGRDIDRFPGGDHTRFLTSCKGCHTVMDGFRGAFASWNYDGRFLVHGSLHAGRRGMNNSGIANKLNQNGQEFPQGYQTTNTSWVNNATRGKNISHFGWSKSVPGQGTGTGAFGRLLANSDRFPKCMARRAFVEVCQRSQNVFLNLDSKEVSDLAEVFKSSNYNLRELLIAAATHPNCK